MPNNKQTKRAQTRTPAPAQRRRALQGPPMNLPSTFEGSASSRRALRTGVPRVTSFGESIVVENNEIAIQVQGTPASGVIPAGGAICIMQFVNAATANFLNNTKWVNKLAIAYDKWILESLDLEFVPSLPFTTAGMTSLFFDSDPSRTAAPVGVTATSGDMRAVSKQVYCESKLKVLRNQLNRLPQYETISGTSVSGVANVGSINFSYDPIVITNTTTTAAVPIGNVWMRYRIRFINPSNSVA